MVSPSAQDILLEIMRRELENPQLSLAQAMEMPFAKALLDTLTRAAETTQSAKGPEDETLYGTHLRSNLSASSVVLSAAIEDTFDMADLKPSEIERHALLGASDIVMIETKRRLRLRDSVRAEIIDAAIGSEPYESMLRKAVAADMDQHAAIGRDRIRLPSAWLRCFLSGEFENLDTAPPGELKAALAARERLRLVSRLGRNVPALEDLRRRVGLAELLEPLRLLTGEQGGWDGTPRNDRFVGRNDEMTKLRAFVDEQRSQGAVEALTRGLTRWGRALIARESPSLMIVEAQGGLGKSTLLAKFVLDHTFEQSRRFPFAYLDFDRAGIDPARPPQLLIEIARQVGLQFPEARPKLEALRESIRAELIRPSAKVGSLARTEIRDPFSRFVEILRQHATFGSRAFLLVLDTLEVVQWDSSAMDRLASLIDEFFSKGLHELRVVASGRAAIPELRRQSEGRPPALSMKLKPLLVKEARQMADALGRAIIGRGWSSAWSAAIVGAATENDARREPLAVRVAVNLVAYAEASERQGLVDDIAKSGFDADKDFVARLYERRIVNHVRDRNARKLAWPGLVVRRITPEIARDLLAELCEIASYDADKAFSALGQEIWMVTKEGDALRHRPDLRAKTLPLMRRTDKKKFDTIAQAAVEYFMKHRNRSREDYVEWIYHRLLAGEQPEDVEPDMTPEVISLLAKSEADFPPTSAVASYLAARTTRTRLSPGRIRALRPSDALYHLSVTSTNSFGFDDVSLDPAVLEVSKRLTSELEVRVELKSWARAIWIKTGAWPIALKTPQFDVQLFGEVLRSHMYCGARYCSTLDPEERARFADEYLGTLMSIAPVPERAGFRTTVHAMALARIAARGAFAMLDTQLARMLSQMKPNPLPSTQAALRTAVVFGERSRVPAVHLWLASRRRSSTERVRNPTISLAELHGLLRVLPNASELLQQAVSDATGAPTRFAENHIVTTCNQVIDEIVEEYTGENGRLNVLSRIFAARDEDWIIPVAYAAARAHETSLSTALSSRLWSYQATAQSDDIPDEMVGAMRLADEAGDLVGFSSLVLSECNPNASATNDLRFLLDCCAAWHRSIDGIIGTDDLPLQAPYAVAERLPEPGSILHRDDPQKDRWGGLETRNGRTARAVLESVERDVFYFSVTVESTDDSTLQPPIVFHLHDSYPRSVVTIRRVIDGRIATLNGWNAKGVFAIGIQVKDVSGAWISLEIDLARLPGLPQRFLGR